MHQKTRAAAIAVAENPTNKPGVILVQPGASLHPAKMAILTGKRWQNGRVLKVRFLDGTTNQRSRTEAIAHAWSQFANVSFRFGGSGGADLRISFLADPGSWSAVGTDCLLKDAFPASEPTMNFGWLRDETDDIEFRRVVLHEFGHALGAIHEHQNPSGGIQWNLAAVYKYFSGPPNNWTKEEIDFNIVQKYSVTQLNATTFDPKSIMLYAFPADLIKGGHATDNNTELSVADKRFIRKLYPSGAQSAAAKMARRFVFEDGP